MSDRFSFSANAASGPVAMYGTASMTWEKIAKAGGAIAGAAAAAKQGRSGGPGKKPSGPKSGD